MVASNRRLAVWLLSLGLIACSDPPDAVAPSFAQLDNSRDTIVVNPNANGKGIAKTIQEGIDRVAAGGTVLIKGGTYAEVLVIDKGLTLEGIGDGSGPAIIAPSGTPQIVVQVATPEPVTIRDLTVHFSGLNGIRGDGDVDVTVDQANVIAINSPLGISHLIGVFNLTPGTGRARLVVRESFLDGRVTFANSPTPAFPQTFTLRIHGDVDGRFERNVIRRAGGACIFVTTRTDLGGETNAEILDNDLDECYPLGRAGAILVGPVGALPSPIPPFTATGRVNTIGNTIRNSFGSCLLTAAINYEGHGGVIAHNRILNVVQPCAAETVRTLRGAIFVGSTPTRNLAAADVAIRFNDIVGNAHAGLRIAANQTLPLDASCNYWGAASGPTAATWPSGTGDAVVVEAGAAAPVITPFATEPIAQSGSDDCGAGWSAPASLGPTINTSANEQGPTLSEDGLSLYFGSDRVGGAGGFDIWVAERDCRECPWHAPTNLGTTINSTGPETGPGLSADGHLLFFTSTRAGGQGGQDLYVSFRTDATDNFAWGAPVSVGPEVNTAAGEAGLEYLPSLDGQPARIFFNRNAAGATADIFVVPATADGHASGPAVPVTELNDAVATDQGTTLRGDGREVVFFSTRAAGFGSNDLWTATRASLAEPWSRPQNLGSVVNSRQADQQPSLSADGRTLLLASSRTGSLGGTDIYISRR